MSENDNLGYFRVGNVKGDRENRPEPGELAILMDRNNPIFGNKHRVTHRSVSERDRVIAAFADELDEDIQRQGPMWREMTKIAEDIAFNNRKVIGLCH